MTEEDIDRTVWFNSPHGWVSAAWVAAEACGFNGRHSLTSEEVMELVRVNCTYQIGRIEALQKAERS